MTDAWDGPLGEDTPPGYFTGIATVDKHLAEVADKDRELADVIAQNDRLQNEVAGMLCRIDELFAERAELPKAIAELRGTR